MRLDGSREADRLEFAVGQIDDAGVSRPGMAVMEIIRRVRVRRARGLEEQPFLLAGC